MTVDCVQLENTMKIIKIRFVLANKLVNRIISVVNRKSIYLAVAALDMDWLGVDMAEVQICTHQTNI